MTSLDFTPLTDALKQLEGGLRDAREHPQSEIIRDGVIHRFERSYDLVRKAIRDVLESIVGRPADPLSSHDPLRLAAEHGVIHNVDRWLTYRSARNKTLFTYDPSISTEVFQSARPFLEDARELLQRLHAVADRAAA